MRIGVVIVGAGHGGSQAAVSLRQEGYDGPVTLISGEPDLPYHRPPLSKAFLKSPEATAQPLRAEGLYSDNGVTLHLGEPVAALDLHARRVELAGGGRVPFDRLVLATGARARPLPVPGAELAGVFMLRTAGDARALREAVPAASEIVVIGGGFIGLEAAASLAQMGKAVTVVEVADRLLGRVLPRAISTHMAHVLTGLGIRLRVGTAVERLEGAGRVSAVVTAAGERIPADLVLVGVGAIANTALADAAGLEVANGIVVGADLRSSDPSILALGDVASYPHSAAGRRLRLESVQNATDQARHVARAIVGHARLYEDVPWFWSDQGPVKLQMAGLAIGADRERLVGDPASGAFSIYHFRGPDLVAVDSVNRPADHMLARRMLGLGFTPDEKLLAEGSAAMKAALAALSPA